MAKKYNISNAAHLNANLNYKTDPELWTARWKDTNVGFATDASAFSLANPDDTLLFVGPPRLPRKSDSAIALVGMTPSFDYTEQSMVQPIKTIGSRLHLFARSNSTVSAQMSRAVFYGPNLLKQLYSVINTNVVGKPGYGLEGDNGDYSKDASSSYGGTIYASFFPDNKMDAGWWGSLGDDLFRVPIGLGVVYNSPGGLNNNSNIGADYLENCQIMARSISIQAGSGVIMENVSIIADRALPWVAPYFASQASGRSYGQLLEAKEDSDANNEIDVK